ncbi:MAG: NADH-quinone oxidoreductase subunit L [Candidatus Kryptoniota bacterium]
MPQVGQNLITLALVVLFLPITGFVLLILFGRKIPRQDLVETSFLFLGLAISFYIFYSKLFLLNLSEINWIFNWIDFGNVPILGKFRIDLGIGIDNVTAIMLVVVNLISFLVHVYSIAYMRNDVRYSRYYAYLGLFTFSMLGIVLTNNLLMMYVSWELVGLSSYLLIGHWYEKKSAADAGKKAFIVNRVGDVGFFIGIMIIFSIMHTFLFKDIFAGIAEGKLAGPLLTAAGILIFCGAVGKSAQFPLHVWLPDAMEGPTPVSALIHAATMVAAGVYLVARVYPMLTAGALTVIAYIGAITAFISATIAIVQNDIKKVLAYSTISQLGYMVMGLGVGAFSAGVFHLVTHAAFKAGLFLAAGSVIYAMHHEQDMRYMGGLRKKMPVTYWSFVIYSLSIAGIPLTSGFLSKDSILAGTLVYGKLTNNYIVPIIGYTVVFLTAAYMFRLIILTFHGEPRDLHKYEHAKESPLVMSGPLIILAALSLFIFYSPNPFNPEDGWFMRSVVKPASVVPLNQQYRWDQSQLNPSSPGQAGKEVLMQESDNHTESVYEETAHSLHYPALTLSLALAALGIFFSFGVYQWRWLDAERLKQKVHFVYIFLINKWYFDEIYNKVIVGGVLLVSRMSAWFDSHVIDGIVNGAASLTKVWSLASGKFDNYVVDGLVNFSAFFTGLVGAGIRRTQTGKVQTYIVLALLGFIVIFFAFRTY